MARLNNILQENIVLKRKISQYQQVLGILPYVDDSIFKGGFRVVGTLADRDKIECCFRKHGMIVIVVGADHSYKQYRLISNNCTNSWEEVVYQFDADETKVDLVENYSELGANLETQRDLNLALKAYVLALKQQIDNIDVEVDDSEVHITENTSQATVGQTQQDFNRTVASTVDANTSSIGALANTKLNKTNITVSGPDTAFKYVYIFDEFSTPRRMLAGDLGKNIANSNLTSIAGSGMTLGSTYTWNTAGQFFYLTGLPNKSSDATFNRLLMEDSNSQLAYTNGRNFFLEIPALLNDTDKQSWRNGMRLSNEIYSIGQPRIDSVILPFIDNNYTYIQYITLIGLNLFVDNQTPTAKLVMKRVKDINGNVLPTPEVYNITNFNVLQTNPNILNFGLNWNTYPQGYYQFFCTHNLLTNLTSPELLVKQGITFTNLNPIWQDLTGFAQVDSNNNIVLGGAGDGRTNVLIDTTQMQNGFVVKCAVNTSVTNIGANFPGPARFTMKGDDGLEYGVSLSYNIDFYPNSVGGFTTNVDVIYISYYNGLLTLSAEVNGKTKVFAVTSIPTVPRYFYAYRAGGGIGSFSARPTQLLLL